MTDEFRISWLEADLKLTLDKHNDKEL